ncbi:hypothetical protein DD238_002347 [Peronospora effusa]|uniref:Rad4 beta-hairpin domain-containing protein n=1 Tax=Peronospora effusa TaxID=542832 RepID=A0A3M6VNL8_9STRA|nr:hypothetical protein DD238_002347 [Peronospora effusa]
MASEDEEFAYSTDEMEDDNEDKKDEEDVDVDWEDVDTFQPTGTVVSSQEIHPIETQETLALHLDDEEKAIASEVSTLQQIDWEEVNRSLADDKQDAPSVVHKKRRPPIRLTKEEKEREKALHQTHLLFLLATRIKWMRLSQSQLLQGLLLSLTATSDVDFFAEMKHQPLSYSLALLVRWFNREFQLVEDQETLSGEMVTESSLLNVFFARKGQDYELPLLFASLCGALQLRYRLTCALDPLLVQRGKVFESSFRQRPSKRRRSQKVVGKGKMLSSDGDEEKEEADRELDPDSTETIDRVIWLWCEVLDQKSQRWIHVDVVRRLVDRPQEVEKLRGRSARFSYVISIQDDELLVDVTSRYTVQWSKSLTLRLADSWWKQVLERFNEDTVDQRCVSKVLTAENVDKALGDEKKELERLKLAEGMPSSVEGFRKHHLYCLERHLGQFECLHPRKVVGVFNGQSVFLREHVQPVQSAFKWRRLGRVVKDDERQKPAKWQSRGGVNVADTYDESDDTNATTEGGPSLALFGLWQTTEFEPESMVDGHVPKNKYGNIEIWSPAHVPRGAVHLQLPRIDTIAESLGIDYAPAVVGFEVRNGRTRPKITGIVVAKTDRDILLDAHAEKQEQTIENAIAHNQKLVLKRWAKLTTRLLLRQRLDDDYGAV